MEKIKAGNFIRTKKGNTDKIQCNFDKDSWRSKNTYGEPIVRCEYDTYLLKDIAKHSKNIIDIIEDEDFVMLEYKSPKYRKRITRKFEVSKIDNYISFDNQHCSFNCKVGDKKIIDKICKNIKIKSIVTKEQFKQVEYKI